MSLRSTPQLKVGFFVLIIIIILAYATIRISKSSLIPGATYAVYLPIESAVGINNKTPVQIAGIQVGYVDKIRLIENNRASLELAIKNEVKLSKNVQARIKTVGFLGDTYIDLYQPGLVDETLALKDKESIKSVTTYGDFSSLTGQMSDIATDIKAITTTMKELMAGQDSSFARSVKNIEKITDVVSKLTTQNQENIQAIISNLKAISENLNLVVARNRANVDATLDNVASITGKVEKGEGTLGRLIHDETTINKINESIDNINGLLGGANKLQVDLGYHAEFLGTSSDFKHYVSLALKPRPDKYFLVEFVADPAPSPVRTEKETTITANGNTSTVREVEDLTTPDKFRITAEFVKKYYGLKIHGGLIESTGGAGLGYAYGPLSIDLSAFDFKSNRGQRPHLKALSSMNVTKSFYLLGGLDDFISKQQDPDWFMGVGIQFTDDDLKSLFGLAGIARP